MIKKMKKMKKIKKINKFIFPAAFLLLCSPFANAEWTNDHKFRLLSSQGSPKYKEQAGSQRTGLSTEQKTDFSGTRIGLGVPVKTFDLSLDFTDYKAKKSDFWAKKSELFVNVGYQLIPEKKWLQGVVTYYSVTNSFDKDHASAPAAHVDASNALGFGFSAGGMLKFSGHGLSSQIRYLYLTTLERSRNFGYDYFLDLGYSYIGEKFSLGIKIGQRIHRFNNTKSDETDPNLHYRVISNIEEQYIGLYLQL